jgi:hypothetical protein
VPHIVFDSAVPEGHRAPAFSWTAALALDLLAGRSAPLLARAA